MQNTFKPGQAVKVGEYGETTYSAYILKNLGNDNYSFAAYNPNGAINLYWD